MERKRSGFDTAAQTSHFRTDVLVVRAAIDFPSSEKLQGTDLKDAVKKRWETLGRIPVKTTAHRPIFETFANHLNDLPNSVWETSRNTGQINTFYSSASSALQYAHLKTEGKLVPPSELTTPEACLVAIEKVSHDSEKSRYFYENIWRPPTSFSPERGTALQYILRHHFPETAITGVDIGTGSGVILPFLNSPRYLDSDFPGKGDLLRLFGNNVGITLDLGLGVDKNEQEENLLWAYTNPGSWAYQPGAFEKIMKEIKPKKDKFPFLTTDILSIQAVADIREALRKNGQQPTVAFVWSSFVRYQLLHDGDTQQTFIDSVTSLLQEGGIWIDIGEEVMHPDNNFQEYNVNVYQKINNRFVVK